MSHGRALYSGAGGFTPAEYFAREAPGVAPPYPQGYNVADYLLEVASDPPVALFQLQSGKAESEGLTTPDNASAEKREISSQTVSEKTTPTPTAGRSKSKYASTFLTQLEYLCGREWKILRRCVPLCITGSTKLNGNRSDKTLFFTHVVISSLLGVFCGKPFLVRCGFSSPWLQVGCTFKRE
jgi:hypothetical protein